MGDPVSRKTFGKLADGTAIELLTLRHASGIELGVINYGCIIVSLVVPDTRGSTRNVVLGHDRLEPYLTPTPYFGALVGRYANRIAGARFDIDGKLYEVSPNERPNHLHGGFKGFDKRVWAMEAADEGSAVRFRRRSRDGEEGYPGNLDVEVTYSIGDHTVMQMTCEATTDAATHVNLTQHSYFNLSDGTDVLSHCLTINANTYLPVDKHLIPIGDFAPVANTPFDFQESTAIGLRVGADHEQLRIGRGYDHNFVLNRGGGELTFAARAFDRSSGRTLEISTTEPGLQFYSGQVVGHRGFCLEPQHFPDSPNRPQFPSTVLRPGQRYRSITRYTFGTETCASEFRT
jgi:aldose 1-epimerase